MKTVTLNALYRRVARKLLREDGEILRTARPSWASDLGWYYTIDARTSFIQRRFIDLLDEGCLRSDEVLDSSDRHA